MAPDRITWHLENWAYWQSDRTVSMGRNYADRASGGIGKSNRSDFDSMVDAADRRCADAVDAILQDECTPLERQVVTHLHLAAVFRFPRIGHSATEAYASARIKVGRGLDRRGIM